MLFCLFCLIVFDVFSLMFGFVLWNCMCYLFVIGVKVRDFFKVIWWMFFRMYLLLFLWILVIFVVIKSWGYFEVGCEWLWWIRLMIIFVWNDFWWMFREEWLFRCFWLYSWIWFELRRMSMNLRWCIECCFVYLNGFVRILNCEYGVCFGWVKLRSDWWIRLWMNLKWWLWWFVR